ncbi:hypothetical protein, partial [Streptomyces sp. NPDC102437]|uniref:hypothetical protein n=1 Tax=Streptomyces sp. NPDC102437 TaxID=3366175 RepID=UPI0037FFC3FA
MPFATASKQHRPLKPAPAAKSAELQQAVDLDLQERRQQTGEAILLFSQCAQRLYGEGREAYLAIEAGRSSLSITPSRHQQHHHLLLRPHP